MDEEAAAATAILTSQCIKLRSALEEAHEAIRFLTSELSNAQASLDEERASNAEGQRFRKESELRVRAAEASATDALERERNVRGAVEELVRLRQAEALAAATASRELSQRVDQLQRIADEAQASVSVAISERTHAIDELTRNRAYTDELSAKLTALEIAMRRIDAREAAARDRETAAEARIRVIEFERDAANERAVSATRTANEHARAAASAVADAVAARSLSDAALRDAAAARDDARRLAGDAARAVAEAEAAAEARAAFAAVSCVERDAAVASRRRGADAEDAASTAALAWKLQYTSTCAERDQLAALLQQAKRGWEESETACAFMARDIAALKQRDEDRLREIERLRAAFELSRRSTMYTGRRSSAISVKDEFAAANARLRNALDPQLHTVRASYNTNRGAPETALYALRGSEDKNNDDIDEALRVLGIEPSSSRPQTATTTARRRSLHEHKRNYEDHHEARRRQAVVNAAHDRSQFAKPSPLADQRVDGAQVTEASASSKGTIQQRHLESQHSQQVLPEVAEADDGWSRGSSSAAADEAEVQALRNQYTPASLEDEHLNENLHQDTNIAEIVGACHDEVQ